MFRSVLARSRSRTVAPRLTRARVKLGAEELESRLVPAVNMWRGTFSTDASYNGNWSLSLFHNPYLTIFPSAMNAQAKDTNPSNRLTDFSCRVTTRR